MSDPNPRTNLYTIGGAVQAGGGLYLPRKADDELLELCRAGSFGYVLTPRQMGKTSLMVRTAERLGEEGVQSVIIDLSGFGVQITPEAWYLGLLTAIEDQLMLKTGAVKWWQAREREGLTQRLVEFFKDVLLKEVEGRVVVFVDEIDTTLSLPFTDDFYAAIRYFYNARAHTPELKRLSFVLIGVATPGDLVRDPQRTPFNIGHRVDLTDFTLEEASPLADGLGLPAEESRQVLGWVMEWTGGHPYLTQRLCRAVAEEKRARWTREDVERLTASVFFGEMSEKDNNLQFVRDMLTKRAPDPAGVLSTYREVLRGRPVRDEEQSIVKSHLKLSGIVHRKGGALRVRNPIYKEVFDARWVAQHLPVNWVKRLQRAAAALALLILIGLIPLSIYAINRAWKAEEKTKEAETQRLKAEESREEARTQALLAEERRQEADEQRTAAIEAQKEADEQRKKAEASAAKEKTARAEAEKQRQIAENQRARAEQEAQRANEQAALAEERGREAVKARDEANRLRQLAFGGQLGALAEITRGQQSNLLQRSVRIARESILQSPEAPPLIGYQALSQGLMLLPRLATELSAQGVNTRNAFTADNKYLVSVSEDPPQTGAGLSYTIRVLDVNDGYREIPSLKRQEQFGDSSLSPDLMRLATKKAGGTGTVTDLATGREVASFTTPKGAELFGLSTGGKLAAFFDSGQQTVSVRDLTANSVVSSWKEEGSVFNLTFSPAGKYLLVGKDRRNTRSGERWTLVLREVATGRELGQMSASDQSFDYPSAAGSYYFSPDDKYIAELEENKNDVVIRPTAEFEKPVARLEDPSTVQLIVFGPTGKILATAGDDNILRVWKYDSNAPVASVKLDDEVTGIVFSPDGNRLAAVSAKGSARVWNPDLTAEVARVIQDDLSDFVFGPGGELVTADSSGMLRVWETKSDTDFVRKIITEVISFPLLTPDGRHLAEADALVKSAVSKDFLPTVMVWDTKAGGVFFLKGAGVGGGEIKTAGPGAGTAALSPDGKYVARTYGDGVKVWEVTSGKLVRAIEVEDPGREVALSTGGKYVATILHGEEADSGSRALVWEVATGKVVAAVKHEDNAEALALSPDGKYFASGGKKIQVVRLDGVPQNIPPITNKVSVGALAFSPQGKYLVAVSDDLKVWERDTGRVVTLAESESRGHADLDVYYYIVAFSGDERYLAAGPREVAYVWDVEAAMKAAKPVGSISFQQDGDVFAVALTRKGDYLVTISAGNYARIWDVKNQREVARLPYRSVESGNDVVAFTGEDDKYLITAHASGAAEVWLWRPTDLAQASCSRLILEENPETFLKEYLDEQLLKNMPLLGGCPKQK